MPLSEMRLLPDGWKAHFDSQRNLWYYVDLSSEPPRISLVHPAELDDKHPTSAPSLKSAKEHHRRSPLQRPAGPRESGSANGTPQPGQRPRRATVAQQLYASGLSVGPAESVHSAPAMDGGFKASSRPPPPPPASSPPVSDGTTSSGSTPNTASSSAGSSSAVSPTSPITPLPSMDVHNPRNFLDYTRLAGTRRVTYSGPQPSIKPRSTAKGKLPAIYTMDQHTVGLGVDALYPASVKTSPSPMPFYTASDPNSQVAPPVSALDNHHMKSRLDAKAAITIPASSPLISTPALTPLHLMPNALDTTNAAAHARREDGLSESQSHPSTLPPTAKEPGVRPLPPTTKANKTALPRPPPQPILQQPKPVRPLAGVSLNLQVQVAGVSSESSPEELADTTSSKLKNKKKPLLKTFTLGIPKNAKGKTPIRTIYDRRMLSSSPITDDFSP